MVKIKSQRTRAIIVPEFYRIHLSQKPVFVSNHYRLLLNVNKLGNTGILLECIYDQSNSEVLALSKSFTINSPYILQHLKHFIFVIPLLYGHIFTKLAL